MFMSGIPIRNVIVNLHIFISVLFTNSSGETHVLESYLGIDGSSHSELDVPFSVKMVHLSCLHGSYWIVPNSIPEMNNDDEVSLKPENVSGSQLILRLPPGHSERGQWRGLYQCCRREGNELIAGQNSTFTWVRRQGEPSCCPCCPWYEQERCLTQPDGTTEITGHRCTHSIFLYTRAIPEEAVQVHIVPGEPMLIPCPALLHSTNWWPEIQLQLVPKYSFGWPWFPFTTPETKHIAYTYDSRHGLCLNKSQFQRSIPYLLCYYPQVNRTRTIQLVWPPPPPTVPPEVQLIFASPGNSEKEEEAALSSRERSTEETSQDLPPIYRVRWGSYIRVYCFASYNQTGIVRRPPPRLCFKWHFHESSEMNDTSNNARGRRLSDCPAVKRTTDSNPPRVYAISEFELPPVQVNTSVECEVVTPARQAASVSKMAHLTIPTQSDVMEVSKPLHWQVESIPVFQSDGHSVAVMNLAQGTTFNLYFWHTNEVGQSPACSLNISNDPESHVTYTVSVGRVSDRWRCRITFALINSSLFGRIIFGYGDTYEKLSLHIINSSTWPRPRVTGMHSHASRPFNLTCKHNLELPSALGKWAEARGKTKFVWSIEFNKTTTKIQSEESDTLELPSVYNETQIRVFNYTHEIAEHTDQILTTDLLLPTKQPSKLCVSCMVSYIFGSGSQSEPECRYLVDFDPTDTDLLSVDLHTSPLLLLLRQPNVRTITSSETAVATIVGGQPADIQCLYLDGMQEPLPPALPIRVWPILKVSNSSNLLGSSAQTVLELSPLWRGMRITLPLWKATEYAEDIWCEFGDRKTALQVHVKDPVKPQILQSQKLLRNVARNDTMQLTCYATGFPAPTVWWQKRNQAVSRELNEEWITVKHCEATKDALNNTLCVHNYTLNASEGVSITQCVATNAFGNAVSVHPIYPTTVDTEGSGAEATVGPAFYLWIGIIVTLVSLLVGISTLSVFICRWTTETRKLGYTNRKCNILYSKCKSYPYFFQPGTRSLSYQWLKGNYKVLRVVAELLGSMEEAYKWTVPVECLQTSTVSLGLGHYGQVFKGWLNQSCARTNGRQRNRKVVEGNATPVAIKAASGEISSLICLRNEIALLPSLSSGPNIIRMIGLTLGMQEDLRDTLLLLEYCSHKSLCEFIRKRAHHITDGDSRTHKWSIQSCDSGVCSLPELEGGLSDNVTCRDCNNSSPDTGTLTDEEGGLTGVLSKHGCTVTETDFHLTICDLYRIAYQISCGLTYLAESGIIHRDLATRNILIDQTFSPKICDFGLAVRISAMEESTANTTRRSEGYQILTHQKQLPFRILPPEALLEQTFYFASDVWEYGLLLWQLFSLETKRPFSTVSTVNELVKLLYSVPQTNPVPAAPPSIDRPRFVHNQLWFFMCQAWRLDPKLRPSAQDFKTMLWNLLNSIHSPEKNERTQEACCNPVHYTEIVQPDLTTLRSTVVR